MIKLYGADIAAQYADLRPVEGSVSITLECVLPDAISCTVTEELNGIYELEMVYVATGINATAIQADKILGVRVPMENDIHENYFRIYRVEKDITGRVYVYARQLAGELSYNIVSMLASSGQADDNVGTVEQWEYCIRAYSDPFPLFVRGNLTSVSGTDLTMAFSNVASIRSYLTGELESPDIAAVDLYACDFIFDKFDIVFIQGRGQERGTVIHYSVNMNGILIDDDLDEVYTSFLLYLTVEDSVISARAETTYAPLFGHVRTKPVDYTQYLPEGMTKRQAQPWLEQKAAEYAQRHNEEGNQVRKIDVDVVAAGIDEIYLGDTVPVVYHRHGTSVNTKMRVVAYTWDVLMQRYVTVTLGAVKSSLAKEIARNGAITDTVWSLSERLTIAENRKVGLEVVSANGGTGYKFSDGTLICAKTVTVTATVNKGWGSLFYNENLASLGDWPVQFLNAPAATISQTGGSDVTGISWHSMSAVSAGSVYLYRPVSTTSQSYTLSVIAIGRWK